jgi:uncharacterized membrane protein
VRLGLDQIYAPKSGDGKVANVVPVERLSPVLAALFG